MKSGKYFLFVITTSNIFCCGSCKDDENGKLDSIIKKVNAIDFKNLKIVTTVDGANNYYANVSKVGDKHGKSGGIHYNTIVDITKDVKDVLSSIFNYYLETAKYQDIGKILEKLRNQLVQKLQEKLTFDLTHEMSKAITVELTFKPKNGICIKDIILGGLTLEDFSNPESSLRRKVDKNKMLSLLNSLIESMNIKLYIDDALAKSEDRFALRNKKVTDENTMYSSFTRKPDDAMPKILGLVFGEEEYNKFANLSAWASDLEKKNKKGENIENEKAAFKLKSDELLKDLSSVPIIGGEKGGIGIIFSLSRKFVIYKC